METIYLSLRAQVAVSTFFMKSPVADGIQNKTLKNTKIDKKIDSEGKLYHTKCKD